MKLKYRRGVALVLTLVGFAVLIINMIPEMPSSTTRSTSQPQVVANQDTVNRAEKVLDLLAIKGRSPKTGYSREQFGDGWSLVNGCDMRNIILYRDLEDTVINQDCSVLSGVLLDPYTGKTIEFMRGPDTSSLVQIDHVVALSDAWQKGAQLLTRERRQEFANDPLELLAVDGGANQQKGDGDAASWLPQHKVFRCEYVSRQVAVKSRYELWVTQAEYDAIARVLNTCSSEQITQINKLFDSLDAD